MLSTIILTAKSRYSKQKAGNTLDQSDQHSEAEDQHWSTDTTALSDDAEFEIPIRNASQKDEKQEAQGGKLQTMPNSCDSGKVNYALNPFIIHKKLLIYPTHNLRRSFFNSL